MLWAMDQMPMTVAPGRDDANEVRWARCSGVFITMSRGESAHSALGELIAIAVAVLMLMVMVVATSPARATQQASKTPIVPTAVAQPGGGEVGTGKPQRTGDPAKTIVGSAELILRRFELIKQAAPGITRVGVLWEPDAGGEATKGMLQEVGKAAFVTGLSVQFVSASDPAQLETALSEISSGQVDAVLVMLSAIPVAERRYVVGTIAKTRLPAMYAASVFVQDGGLMSYGARRTDVGQRTGPYADRILKKANPVDLQVEMPTKFELVVNVNTAHQLGITFNREFLSLVDKIVE